MVHWVEGTDGEVENWFTYHKPFGSQTERYETIRETAKVLAKVIVNCCPTSEERKAALNFVRQAVMWANAGIAVNEGQE